MFHLLDGRGVLFLEYLLSSVGDHLLVHLLIRFEEEFEPASLWLLFDLDTHLAIDCLVLLLNEGDEIASLVLEFNLPSDTIGKLPQLVSTKDNNTDDDQVEKSQLNNQEENVSEQQEYEELDQVEKDRQVAWEGSLSWLVLELGFKLMLCVFVSFVQFLLRED